jgi:excisionase family DNA binding protein
MIEVETIREVLQDPGKSGEQRPLLFDIAGLRLLTYAELSAATGIAKGTLQNLVSRKEIPHVKLGHSVRFQPNEIAAWLKERSVPHVSRPRRMARSVAAKRRNASVKKV